MGCILSYHPTLLSCSAIPTFMFVDDIFLQQVHTWIEVAYACGKTYANCCEVWKCSVSLSPKQLASVYGYLSLHCWSLASHSSSVSESRLCLALSLHHTSFSVLPISHPARAMCTNDRQMFICVCPGKYNARRRSTYTLYMHSAEKDVMALVVQCKAQRCHEISFWWLIKMEKFSEWVTASVETTCRNDKLLPGTDTSIYPSFYTKF